jgi:hypothetical protein
MFIILRNIFGVIWKTNYDVTSELRMLLIGKRMQLKPSSKSRKLLARLSDINVPNDIEFHS